MAKVISMCAFSGAVLLLVVVLSGCQEKSREPVQVKPELTLENLQDAYGREIRREVMYTQFAGQAQKERLTNLANLYRALARSESIHSGQHAGLLRAQDVEPVQPESESVVVGTALQTLRKAISGEQVETESLYPALIRVAMQEGYTEAVDRFKKTLDADVRHLELLREALDKQGRTQRVPYSVCPECGYILTTSDVVECPNCNTPGERFEKL